MSVREYVGARYVPLFADPLEWDATRTYEPLTVVLYQGNSFTSRQAVPANIPITNTAYWAQTGNYNAQVEQYRAEVETYDGRITANTTAITNEASARSTADENLSTRISANATAISDEVTARQTAITTEIDARITADNTLGDSIATVAGNLSTETQARIDADADIVNMIHDYDNQYYGKKFICVTDSWGTEGNYGVTKCWMRALVEDCFNGTYIDLHAGSTGYIHTTETNGNFITRLTNWVTTHPTEVDSIDYVLVSGSPNDYNNSVSQIKAAVVSFINYALNNLPNAKVILVPQVANYDISKAAIITSSAGTNPWINASASAQLAYNENFKLNPRVIPVKYLTYVMFSSPGFFNSDNTHPNQAGHNWICGNVFSYLLTGHVTPISTGVKVYGFQAATDWASGSALKENNRFSDVSQGSLRIVDGIAYFACLVSVSSGFDSGTTCFMSIGNLVPLGGYAKRYPISGGSWWNSSRQAYFGALSGRDFGNDSQPYSVINNNTICLCPFYWYAEGVPQQGDKMSLNGALYLEIM